MPSSDCVGKMERCRRPVHGYGKEESTIVILGEAPGEEEYKLGKPFVGPSGKLLRRLCDEVGLPFRNCWVTNTCKGYIEGNPTPKVRELKPCLAECLTPEIEAYPRKLIIALGNVAGYAAGVLRGITGVMAARGSIYPSKFGPEDERIPVFLTIHPSLVIRAGGGETEQLLKKDLAACVRYLKFGETPQETASSAWEGMEYLHGTSGEIQKVFNDAKKSGFLAVDIETDGLNPLAEDAKIVGIACSGHPTRGLFARSPNSQAEVVSRLKSLADDPDVRIVGHNCKFDARWLHVFFDLPWTLFRMDTMSAYHLLQEEGVTKEGSEEGRSRSGLGILAESFLGWPNYKDDMKAEMAHQKMSEIDPAEVHDYACRDAIATFRLAQIFWKKIEDEDLVNCHEKLILPAWQHFSEMESLPLRVDVKLLGRARVQIDSEIAKAERRMKEMYGDDAFNPRSHQQMRAFLFDKCKVPTKGVPKTEAGELSTAQAAVDYLLTRDLTGPQKEAVDLVSRHRALSKMQDAFVSSVLDLAEPIGGGEYCIRPRYLTASVETGRTCVAGDTLVETSAGPVAISMLDATKNTGYRVLTHRNRWRGVTRVWRKGKEAMYDLKVKSGRTVRCTARHRVLTDRGWRMVGELLPGDRIAEVAPVLYPSPRSEGG